MSGMTTRFWEKIEPVTEYYRELQDFPAWLSESEYLYTVLEKYLEENPDIHG